LITSSCIKYTSPRAGFELITLVMISTNCTGSYKSNYHTILAAPKLRGSCSFCRSHWSSLFTLFTYLIWGITSWCTRGWRFTWGYRQ
jgi:hypothetical protein